ncbi:Bug family tripartite tricarboxylate transporter substrate binding protein [Phreatobacter oligotrophus]|uniref:Tripartite-type tricarboxylate transporter receptor subunit TctC n=1 Tax=Phreatobacter oligotrophus TaxID=1122261 RepID=A0A2T4YLQ5_9HYPH|nr:tripartite tricarboxylate transporter substrate-binding protein [Phreatobacter oligotrophus]PTM44252.1 tripartite-type tricarboxylate transporter receptor subunit TctC [Phreatobacter oligotrophus]
MKPAALIACLLSGLISPALADAASQFPQRAITLVVPYAAGGTNDTLSRIIGEHLAKTLGRAVLIENDAGAAGTLAARRLARAVPDGHTLIMGNMGTHAVAVSQYRSLGYRPLTDFTPIGLVASVPAVVVARRDFPGTTLVDLQAALRAKPEGLAEAHIGVGSPTHTFCTLLHDLMGTRAVRVAYRGGSQAMSDLVGGHADFSCISLSGAISQINSGSLKALAVATRERVGIIPAVPTAAESGLPGFEVSTWNGLFAPRDLPPAIRDKLAVAIDHALADPGVQARLIELGFFLPKPAERGGEVLGELVAQEIPRWAAVLKTAGIAPE